MEKLVLAFMVITHTVIPHTNQHSMVHISEQTKHVTIEEGESIVTKRYKCRQEYQERRMPKNETRSVHRKQKKKL